MSCDKNTTQRCALRPVGDLMKALTEINPFALSLAIALSITMAPATALPQDEGTDDVIEEIVTTGTRRQGQSPTETLSPIDVLGGDLIANQAAFDLTDGLTKIMPSINTQRFPIADGTAFIRPVSLRNLSPDHTLVLVNGTRRHRSNGCSRVSLAQRTWAVYRASPVRGTCLDDGRASNGLPCQ